MGIQLLKHRLLITRSLQLYLVAKEWIFQNKLVTLYPRRKFAICIERVKWDISIFKYFEKFVSILIFLEISKTKNLNF